MQPEPTWVHIHSRSMPTAGGNLPFLSIWTQSEQWREGGKEPLWLLGPAVGSHTCPPLLCSVPSGRVTETIWRGVGQSISGFTFWGLECQRIGGLNITLHRCWGRWQATSLGVPSEGESPWPSCSVATSGRWAGGEQARDTPALWIFWFYSLPHPVLYSTSVLFCVDITVFWKGRSYRNFLALGDRKQIVCFFKTTNQPAKLLLCLCSVMSDSFVTPVDSSPPGFSVHGILQARILEWVAIPFSRGSSRPRDQTHVSCISYIGMQILYHYATWEAPDVTIDSSDIHYKLKF